MVLYVLFFFCVGIILFWLVLTQPAHKSAAFLTNGGPLLLIVLGCVLTLFRRGAIGVPLVFLGLSWWRRNHARRPAHPSGGRKSTVRSTSLEMELDHDTGEIDGRVLNGQFEGARLSSLSEEELLSLYRDVCSDADSAALLTSYLDRNYPDWQERVGPESSGRQAGASGFSDMTRQEAYQILGLEPGASQQEIHQAWRRLIKAVHPDHGGSPFLSAKINAARDVLLD